MGLKMSCCERPHLEENKDNEIFTEKKNGNKTFDKDKNKDFKSSQNIDETLSDKKRTMDIQTLEGGDNTIDSEKRKNLKSNHLGNTDKIEEGNENDIQNISHNENDKKETSKKNEIAEVDENEIEDKIEKKETKKKNEIVEVDENDQKFEDEFQQINKNDNLKIKNKPQYENEIKIDEEKIYEISDEKSDKIFEMFNNVRLYPNNYINQVNEETISNLLKEANEKKYKPNALIKNISFFYQFREGLMNIYATPRDDEDLLEDVYQTFFKEFKKYKYYYVECPINNEEEAVWNLIKKYENNAIQELLLKYISYCLICALPIIDTDKMKVYFMLLE